MSQDSIRKVVRCRGICKTGQRCKRRTAKTDECYAHLEKDQHLKIKKSQIPNAGMGLYTTVRRPIHRMIAPYTGRQITKPNTGYGGDYAIQLTANGRGPPYKYVDANRTTDGAGRYANEAKRRDHFTNNSHLALDPRNPYAAKVTSTRAIPAGKEIMCRYGNAYWN